MPNISISKQSLIESLKRLVVFLDGKWGNNTPTPVSALHSLAPKVLRGNEELERVKPYLNSLKQAVETPDINNIALTGGYGSGKSTILRTFQDLYKNQFNFLNISLASFKDNKEGKENPDFERRLEVSILQQMFYHVKADRIPDSRFKRITNLTNTKLVVFSLGLILWGICTLILFQFDYINTLNPKRWDIERAIDWIGLGSITIFFGGLSFFVKSVYRLLKNSKINKLTIKGELELAESVEDKSVFNQHIEEILYFFEMTNFNVIIIEDLDRFESTDIFTKLREINILINNSETITRPIKFVYAIKDEMFVDKNERVKFFEFIIPVIPFINPTNAKEQLTRLINEAGLQGVLSTDFTSDVVTFIDDIDMRLLINIFHEYQMYKTMLNNSLNQDKLFAMTVYKNLYPDDFGELQKRRGNLFNFFAGKPRYTKELISELKKQIEVIDEQIKNIEKEDDKSIEELRAVYINTLISKLGGFGGFYIKQRHLSSIEVLDTINFKELRNKQIQYNYTNYGVQNSGINFSEIEKLVDKEFTYEEREQLILDKKNGKIDKLKQKKQQLNDEIQEIENYNIQTLFSKINFDEQTELFKDNLLMRNLLLNGYIDEDYDDYISLFHEINLTKGDYDFIRKIKSGMHVNHDYSLTKVDNILKEIQDKYFKQESILNYSILTYLLENHQKHKIKLDYFFVLLSNNSKSRFEFIRGYIQHAPAMERPFIERLCSTNRNIWQYLSETSEVPDNYIRTFVTMIFNHATKEDIYKFNSLNTLENYLSQMKDLFNFSSELNHISTLKAFIVERNIKVHNLDTPNVNIFQDNLIFKSIYENNLYKITPPNIEKIVIGHFESTDTEVLRNSHFSTISTIGLPKLQEYLNDNFEEYMNKVLLKLDENVNETEDTIIEILNRNDLNDENKEAFLERQVNKVQRLSSIEDIDVKGIILKHVKLETNWDNIWDYYISINTSEDVIIDDAVLDDTLITYLNRNDVFEKLSTKRLDTMDDDILNIQLSDNLLKCDTLTIQAYTSLLDSLPNTYSELIFNTLSLDKVVVIVDKKKLLLTQSNIDGLKNIGHSLHIKLLEVYSEDLSEKLNKLEIDVEDYTKLLKSNSLHDDVKLDIIRNLDSNLIIASSNLAKEITKLLPEDKLIIENIKIFIYLFPFINILDRKLSLLCLYLNTLSNEDLKELLLSLGNNYEKVFKKQNKPVFGNTPQHIAIFNHLKKNGSIIRFEHINEGKSLKVIARYDK